MKKIESDTLSLWQKEGSLLLQQNFKEFRNLVAQAKDFEYCGNYNAAAVYAEIAALHAVNKHCGLFVSPELESILTKIGQKVIRISSNSSQLPSLHKTQKHVFHVATLINSIGGHSRMICRWIQQDANRTHSIVVTHQDKTELPNYLKEAVSNCHGKIIILNEKIGDFDLIAKAQHLREVAATADLIVLHTHMYDVVPTVAFANKEKSPPILFLDHADHLFWIGTSISDMVVSLRDSGRCLAQTRRDINIHKSALLPIIVEPTQRVLSRKEAKQQLGISEDSILLLSIARAIKYRAIDGISFLDAHLPLIKQYKQIFLIVVGPGAKDEYFAAIQQAEGRIIVYPEREDTAMFYQAADIYVDSFPFISTTSLLEAGSYGVPLVSRFPFSDASAVLGADTPGLKDNLIRSRDLEEYRKTLSHLIEDEEFRLTLGEETRKKIVETHTGEFWQKHLEKVYSYADTKPKEIIKSVPKDQIFVGEPDVFINSIHGLWNDNIDWVLQPRMPILPLSHRLRFWWGQIKKNGFGRRGRISILIPQWFYRGFNAYNRFIQSQLKERI
jgi:glycosyltransferase involved in cell wall biosynthesis